MTYFYKYITATIRRPIIQIIISVEINISYSSKALFAEVNQFGHGILGQLGFFDHFDVKLLHQKQIIEIEPVKLLN